MNIRHTAAITNGLGNPLGLLVPVCTYACGIILPTVRALLVLGDNTTQKWSCHRYYAVSTHLLCHEILRRIFEIHTCDHNLLHVRENIF